MKINYKDFIRKNVIIIIILLIVIGMSIVSPYFFTYRNLISILNQIAIYGIVAIGMTFAIIGGNFDLSVGSTFALASIVFSSLADRLGYGQTFLLVLFIGLAVGSFVAVSIVKLKINSFITTLGMMIIVRGVAFRYSQGETIYTENTIVESIGSFSFAGITIFAVVFILLGIVSHFILRYTGFGRNVYANGGNREVARISGIRVDLNTAILFMITGTLSALAGVLMAHKLGAGSPIYGDDLAIYAIASVVIGGTSLSGGRGSVVRTIIGLIFMGIVFNTFSLINVYTYIQTAFKGAIVVAVVMFDSLSRRNKTIEK